MSYGPFEHYSNDMIKRHAETRAIREQRNKELNDFISEALIGPLVENMVKLIWESDFVWTEAIVVEGPPVFEKPAVTDGE